MECPKCRTELPLWAQRCLACGTVVVEAPPLQAPPGVEGPVAPAAPPGAAGVPDAALLPPPEPPKDYAPHLQAGAALAFVATLVVPPLTGPVAAAIGYLVWQRGSGRQRRQGLWLVAASILATAVGLGIAFWVQQSGLLAP